MPENHSYTLIQDMLYHWGRYDRRYELWRGLHEEYADHEAYILDALQATLLKERVQLLNLYYDEMFGGIQNAKPSDSLRFELAQEEQGKIVRLVSHYGAHTVAIHLYIHAYLLNEFEAPNPLNEMRQIVEVRF